MKFSPELFGFTDATSKAIGPDGVAGGPGRPAASHDHLLLLRADDNRDRDRRHRDRRQQGLLPHRQRAGRVCAHDLLDSCRKGNAAHAGDARQLRLQRKPARLEDAVRVHLGPAALPQYGFVARPLALGDQPRARPPDERVEPARRLHHHVQREGEVVPALDVTQLVRDDGVDLVAREPLLSARGPKEHGAEEADDARLSRYRRRTHRQRGRDSGSRPARAHDARDAPPAHVPGSDNSDGTRAPQRQEQHREVNARSGRLVN
jgi:hypothetical protein